MYHLATMNSQTDRQTGDIMMPITDYTTRNIGYAQLKTYEMEGGS